MAYTNAAWRRDQLRFELYDDASEHPIVTLTVDSPLGELFVMAEVVQSGRSLVLRGLHVHGDRARPNSIGPANLAVVVQALMEVTRQRRFARRAVT